MTLKQYALLIPPGWGGELMELVGNETISLKQAKEIHRDYVKERIDYYHKLLKDFLKIDDITENDISYISEYFANKYT